MKQLTLGELIDRLKMMPQDEEVRYDFVHFRPTSVDSYRGYYDQLALGYTNDYSKPALKVKELVN